MIFKHLHKLFIVLVLNTHFKKKNTLVFPSKILRLLGNITTVEDLLRQGIVDLVAFCGTNLELHMMKRCAGEEW